MCSVAGVGAILTVAASAVASNQGSRKVSTGSTKITTAPVDAYAYGKKAEEARAQGTRKVNAVRNAYLQSEGKTQSTLAAGNVSLASGSAVDLLVNNRAAAQHQMNTIAHESEVAAWEYDVAKTKADAYSVVPTRKVHKDSWGDTLTNPLFIINTAQTGLSLFRKR